MDGFVPTFAWYADEHRSGRLGQEEFEALLPDAEARVDERVCHRDLASMPEDETRAYKRAVCAACDALADPAASSWSAGGVSESDPDAASKTVGRAIDRALCRTRRLLLYGAWL